jgi:hypothetical protein
MDILDNFLSQIEHAQMLSLCKNSRYVYGEVDEKGSPPTGLTCELDTHNNILLEKLFELNPEFRNKIDRFYINCFGPSEMPYFHIDAPEGQTVLYYPHDTYNENEGGETQLLGPDDLIYGVKPRPNRLLIFNSNIRHRATPFRSTHRFTIVAKIKI